MTSIRGRCRLSQRGYPLTVRSRVTHFLEVRDLRVGTSSGEDVMPANMRETAEPKVTNFRHDLKIPLPLEPQTVMGIADHPEIGTAEFHFQSEPANAVRTRPPERNVCQGFASDPGVGTGFATVPQSKPMRCRTSVPPSVTVPVVRASRRPPLPQHPKLDRARSGAAET